MTDNIKTANELWERKQIDSSHGKMGNITGIINARQPNVEIYNKIFCENSRFSFGYDAP